MITAYVRSNGMLTPVPVEPHGVIPEEVVWIDLLEPSPEEERFVDEALGLDVPSEEEMQEIEVSSRLYQERNALYMTVTLITGDRKSVVWGKRVEVRVGLGGCCNIKKK